MTDHTAIIERMARAIGETYDGSADPVETPNNWARAVSAAEAALTASGLLDVLEKAEALDTPLENLRTADGNRFSVPATKLLDLHFAIKRAASAEGAYFGESATLSKE